MAIDWKRLIVVTDEDTVNLICGKEILYVRGLAAGRGIASIAKTGTDGLVDTYTITYTDGTSSTFEITNGKGIAGIDLISSRYGLDTYRMTYSDGTYYDFYIVNGNYVNGNGYMTVKSTSSDQYWHYYELPTTENAPAQNLIIEFSAAQSGSGTPSSSNIRALVGTKMIWGDVYKTTSSSTFSRSLGDFYYGGYFDIITGVLTQTWEHIASYAGESLPGRWISDRDVYIPGTVPTTGAEVAYELAVPVEIQKTALATDFYDTGTKVKLDIDGGVLGDLTGNVVAGGKEKIEDYINARAIPEAPNNGYFYYRRNQAWHNVKNGIVLYVDGTNGSDSNDGSSAANAFKTIQTAINKAAPNTAGCQIVIAAGTYSETVTIQDIGAVLYASGNVTLTGVWTVLKAIILLEGTSFTFSRMLRVYHNAYFADNGLSSLKIATTYAYENSLEVYGATFVAKNPITIGYNGSSDYFACWVTAGAKVSLGPVTIQSTYGLYAEYGAIIGAYSLTGGTYPKTTAAGGRIFIGDQNSAPVSYGYCETVAGNSAKVVTIDGFQLVTGATIFVKFKYYNSASNPTLNVNGTGAKSIKRYGSTSAGTNPMVDSWQSESILTLTYDGTYWVEHYWFNTAYNFDQTPRVNSGNPVTSNGIYEFVQAAMADLVLSLICINVVLDGTVYKLEYCGPFEITEADGIYYLNWCGMAETCPFTIDLVGTNYVLKYNE